MKRLASLFLLLSISLSLSAQKDLSHLDSISKWLSSKSDNEYLALLETIERLSKDKSALNNRFYQHQHGHFY
jgi:hypothetical protein